MFKKCIIAFVCLCLVGLVTSFSFSQDPAAKDAKKTDGTADATKKDADAAKKVDDKAGAVPKEDKEAGKLTVTALEARTYSDGVNTFVNSKVQFKLSSKDNLLGDKTEYKIDAGTPVKYENPFSIDKEGKHVITYYSIDKIGNKEDEKQMKVIVDNTPPDVTVTSSKPVIKIGDKIYVSKDFTFTITAKDDLSGVNKIEYTTNGKDYKEYVAPFNIPADGEIDLKVKAMDNVTNITEKFAIKLVDDSGKDLVLNDVSLKLFSDNVIPVVEIKPDKTLESKEGKLIAGQEVQYAVNAADKESGIAMVLVRVDGKGDFIPYMKAIQFTTNGEHTIEAKALDKVGNVSTIAVLSVYVDTIPPDTKIETMTK